ncbi:MAG: DMT family transporter [Paracoccaceae bacterium]|jgi:drug/metabolite transporter (DMT)-like permease|nr:DMT family transporter [Paracoccaceae bacterium]MDG2249072.1 DMT family transporter [Paracoccaceae bacterium]|tara:strand:- start:961 stop:1875 length:915 start_codon:yes stop_codon:yes gene_type:complete
MIFQKNKYFQISSVSSNRLVTGNALAFIAIFLFAAGFPAAEVLLEIWHPITLMFFRLLLAVSTLVIIWILLEGLPSVLKAPWLKGIKIGLLGFGLGTNLLLFAQWFTDPITVALLATLIPVSATILEVWDRRRKLNTKFILGLLASIIGGFIAVSENISIDLGWGVLMALASGFCFMWASDKSVTKLSGLSSIARSSITFTGAAVFTTISFLVLFNLGLIEIPNKITTNQLFSLIIYSVISMAISQVFFIASVDKVGIAISSLHLNFSPFYVMIILFILGGAWDLRAAVGASIVAFGVWLAQSK